MCAVPVRMVVQAVLEQVREHAPEPRAEGRAELRVGPQSPPGVHDADGLGVVVDAVLVAVDPVRAAVVPGAQPGGGGAQRRIARAAQHTQHPGQDLVAAEVDGAGVLHRIDQLGQAHLAPAPDSSLDPVRQEL